MCGIVVLYRAGGKNIVDPMLEVMRHRGPDDVGVFESGDVCLGVRRLAIIDVAGGHQPISSEDGSVTAILNGEIYNYPELRAQLIESGHRFASHADTEVIVHGLEEWGIANLLGRLTGMFAFAVWHEPSRRLHIARDRLGIKPLYWVRLPRGLAFASEIKALLRHPEVSAAVNTDRIAEQVANRFVTGEETLFRGIRRVPPATRVAIADGSITETTYWSPPEPDASFRPSLEEAAGEVHRLLKDAVRYRLVSDVPVGALLSGGLDSTVVVTQMAELSSTPVKTFTVGFDGGPSDERPYARIVSQELGTDHTEELVALEATDEIEDVVWHLDEPLGDAAALPTLLISRVARQSVTVALTGEGADELFGGYPRYRLSAVADRLYRVPQVVWQPLLMLASPLPGAVGHVARRLASAQSDRLLRNSIWMSGLTPNELRGICPGVGPAWPTAYGCGSDIAPWREDMRRWLVDDVLLKVDKMSMATSLEARVPFLDHKLVEFVSQLPEDIRTAWLGKKLLRKAFETEIPLPTLQRRKAPFKPPLDQWFLGSLGDRLEALVSENRSFATEFLSLTGVRDLLNTHRSKGGQGRRRGRGGRGLALWSLFVLEVWWRKFFNPS